ncbi:MAG TPA: hypothetical protein VJ227_04495 [Patescibacteria group bacterium]|nr:hypothetical protein [Patescibacteria group bacterium]
MTELPPKSSDQIRFGIIIDAYSSGKRFGNVDASCPPWLRNGLRWLAEGKKISVASIKELDQMGGTDHPDPWFG